MEFIKFSDIFTFAHKSHIKAGDGLNEGTYPFFTSSLLISKYTNSPQFDLPSLIFGTGGSASIHICERPFSVSTDCFVAQIKHNVANIMDTKFVYYYLFGNINILEKGFRGAGLRHIAKEYINNIDIPRLPMSQQISIVRKLDNLVLLKEKRNQSIKRINEYINSLFFEMFGDTNINKNAWPLDSLKNCCEVFSDGPFGSNLKTEHYQKEGIRVIRLGNIGVNEFLDDKQLYISIEHYQTIKRHTCLPGDILIATLGDPNLRACILPSYIRIAVNKADCLLCRPKLSKISPQYLCYLLNSPGFLMYVSKLIHGQTRSRISSGQLKDIKITVPPLELQNQFSEIVQVSRGIKEKMSKQTIELDKQFQALVNNILID